MGSAAREAHYELTKQAMRTNNGKVGIVLAMLLVGIAGALVLFLKARHPAYSSVDQAKTDGGVGEKLKRNTSADASAVRDYFSHLNADDFTTYTHPGYGFSFPLPKDFAVSTFEEGKGETVIFEHPGFKMGFQITISPFDEPGPLTKERVARDLPSLPMEETIESSLADGTPVVRFSSRDPSLGETREMWFISGGHLYQVSMYAADEEWLDAWIRELAQKWTFGPA